MRKEDLRNEQDRKHAEREENRHRARTYKDKPTQPKERPPKPPREGY